MWIELSRVKAGGWWWMVKILAWQLHTHETDLKEGVSEAKL